MSLLSILLLWKAFVLEGIVPGLKSPTKSTSRFMTASGNGITLYFQVYPNERSRFLRILCRYYGYICFTKNPHFSMFESLRIMSQ